MITQAKVQGAVVTLSASPSTGTGEVSIQIGYVSSDARLLDSKSLHIPAATAEEWARAILDAATAAREAMQTVTEGAA